MSEIKEIFSDLQKTAKDLKDYIKEKNLKELSTLAKNLVVTSAKDIDKIIEKNGLKEVKSRLNKDKKQLESLAKKVIQSEGKRLADFVKTTNKELDKVQSKVEKFVDKIASDSHKTAKKKSQKSKVDTEDSSL